MLLTNQRLEKLSAARVDLTARGMMTGTCLSAAYAAAVQATLDHDRADKDSTDTDSDDDSSDDDSSDDDSSDKDKDKDKDSALHDTGNGRDDPVPGDDAGRLNSEEHTTSGRENGKDHSAPGFRSLHIARVRLLFSYQPDRSYAHVDTRDSAVPCALIEWFSQVEDEPDEDSGLWVVEPDLDEDGCRELAVVHIETEEL
ncbi:hypothetical protein TRAPUB_11478 [Trametes pubescens]|uniref:Uncharacterized protein n=1 Tax=Trametes pubescens TaxID=154538 RepID=A0A1M2VWI5_TRAPU|nr:hypothetical protein TRAPUB_11478 [Trametes pubescens]